MVTHVYAPTSAAELREIYTSVHNRLYGVSRDREYRKRIEELQGEIAAAQRRIAELEAQLGTVQLELHQARAMGYLPGRFTEVIAAICQVWQVKRDNIFSPSRIRRFNEPRGVAMAVAYHLRIGSCVRIGRWFDRDHSTVLHAIHKHKAAIAATGLDLSADPLTWITAIFAQVHPCDNIAKPHSSAPSSNI